MVVRSLVRVVAGVALMFVIATSPTAAMAPVSRSVTFTFSAPVAFPGVSLPPGTYVFEVLNPDHKGDLVRVLSGDRSRVYLTQPTVPVNRLAVEELDATVTFGESLSGIPVPVKAYFPDGATLGRAFIY